MPRDLNDSCSDLARAGAISRRLRGEPEHVAATTTTAPTYVAFSAARFHARPPSQPVAPVAAVTRIAPDRLSGSSGWAHVLDWCLEQLDADSAFVMDGQGLVIASRGPLEGERAQGVGARLVMAFEHADRMQDAGTNTQTIAIEFDGLWMTGLRVRLGHGNLTIGLLGPEPLSADQRDAVTDALTRKACEALP